MTLFTIKCVLHNLPTGQVLIIAPGNNSTKSTRMSFKSLGSLTLVSSSSYYNIDQLLIMMDKFRQELKEGRVRKAAAI